MNAKRQQAQENLLERQIELTTLKMLHNNYVAQHGPLSGVEAAAYDSMHDRAQDQVVAAERLVKQYSGIEYLKWLHFAPVSFTSKKNQNWYADARYTKEADDEGYYHWNASAGPVTMVAGMGFREVQDKLNGKFKKRAAAKKAAWAALDKLVKKYKKVERKHVPAKRTNRDTIKREHDADGNPILTDAEQSAKERALHGLNKAISKRNRR